MMKSIHSCATGHRLSIVIGRRRPGLSTQSIWTALIVADATMGSTSMVLLELMGRLKRAERVRPTMCEMLYALVEVCMDKINTIWQPKLAERMNSRTGVIFEVASE